MAQEKQSGNKNLCKWNGNLNDDDDDDDAYFTMKTASTQA